MEYFPKDPESLLKDNHTILSHSMSGTANEGSRSPLPELESVHEPVRISKTVRRFCRG